MKAVAVAVVLTSASGFWRPRPPLELRPASGPARDEIVVDDGARFQPILGFGAALTDASAYLIDRLPSAERRGFLRRAFSPDGLSLNICRLTVGASDYSRFVYSYDDAPGDAGLSRFSIGHDRAYIIPLLHSARAVNPGIFAFASPWSPPGWMKSSGSMLGGKMLARFVDVYARYLLRYLLDYARAGVRVDALTVQNEPGTDQFGRMPACLWSAQDEADLVKRLAPMIAENGLATRLWIHDHNYDLWRRPDFELQDPGVRAVVAGVAFHGYGGEPEQMTRLHERHPDIPIYWTEGGPDLGRDYGDWVGWGRTITQVMRNWARSFTAWNLALDERGKPNIGPWPCGGLITIDSRTRALSYSGQYWALGHFSRFVRRGAFRVRSDGEIAGVSHAAFLNPDGRIILVLANAGPARTVSVRWRARRAAIALPERSIATLAWPS